ncbi:hypothetical protein H2202_005852 [Exophiala xenobiotica]|nr:hypothetical protein H2202_005852 [Exophiala xenobiotica]KAK5247704.1 hypothetical protein LTS06_007203 [Exophiala xenobiotica]KAK5377926.1 hypothetical protein LTS03_004802 [Exophiala xenobiotica]KAK5389343.1 hypothetical protein LTR11_000153 [Exophiala xenobiotica]KAK5418731.1 hypothetical protein LTR06_002481 [Exophiala xenobiotica]
MGHCFARYSRDSSESSESSVDSDDRMRIVYVLNDNCAAPNGPKKPPREKYTDEEAYFIWYHRIDLNMPWDQVKEAYSRTFSETRKKAGLQCRFYRIVDQHKVTKVRQQGRPDRSIRGGHIEKFGVIAQTDRRYYWMRPEHLESRPLPILWARPGNWGAQR